MNTPKDKQSKENECSDIWTYLAELEASPWQPSNLGEYRQLNLWKSTPMHNQSCDRISQISPSIQTSETTTQNQESLNLSQWDFPVQEQVTQEVKQDSNIQLPHSGEKDLDVSLKLNPSSVLWNSLKELSEEDLELFLPPSIWQDTVLRLKQSRRQSLGAGHQRHSDCLSFPTLTSGQTNSKMRPAGQVKCEKWFKDKGLIPSGSSVRNTGDRSDDGLSVQLVRGSDRTILEESDYTEPSKTPGRIRARYLAGRTVTPAQASIALRRVLYLNSLSHQAT